MGRFLEFLVKKRTLLRNGVLGIMAVLVVLDLLIPSHYNRFPWDDLGGFGAVFGFLACVLIIIVSKALGYAFLYRSEDYYDR